MQREQAAEETKKNEHKVCGKDGVSLLSGGIVEEVERRMWVNLRCDEGIG
jgi:hypothetical protein